MVLFKHFTDVPFKKFEKPVLNDNLKPEGSFWLSYGDDWLKFLRDDWGMAEERFKEETKYVQHFKLDKSKLITLTTYDDIEKFTEKYRSSNEFYRKQRVARYRNAFIDWKKVSKDYSGIFIKDAYATKPGEDGKTKRARFDFHWYYGWDVRCAAIWNEDAIISFTQLTH
jgi:hypothetical protein